MIVLEVRQGDEQGRVLELELASIGIGRAASNQVVLPDYHLSGEHGLIYREDDRYIYRDLRSTNGSRIRRAGSIISLDEQPRREMAVLDGDEFLLGDPQQPVVLACRIRVDEAEDEGQRVITVRRLSELPEVEGRALRDPELAGALFRAVKRLGDRGLELPAVLDRVAGAIFELVARATHLTILLADPQGERFTAVLARARGEAPLGAEVRGSRAVLRRVLRDRAAVLAANAPEELGGSESIMGAQILSTLAVPLWDGDQIRGVLQCDNRASTGIFRERDLEALSLLAVPVALAVDNALLIERLRVAEEQARGENRYLKVREERRRFAGIIGESPAMRAVFSQLEKVMDTRVTVCIEGETGTGKELVASAIHYQGKRRDKLFVAQNCAAMTDTLLESELFGHKKGSFTGADHDKRGLFELADGGTLFLDEIGEMSLSLQAKLLRVLQEGEVRPVGSPTVRPVDVRILCATNRSLEAEVEGGRFRQDLYYRIKVFPIRVPPLRERREDIPPLAEHFLRKYCAEMNRSIAGFSQDALAALVAYAWPGNVRELENEVQRLVIQSEPGGFLQPEHLSPQIRRTGGMVDRIAPRKGTLRDRMEEVERFLLVEALREHGGNKTRTAQSLGITREGLHKKLAKFGI